MRPRKHEWCDDSAYCLAPAGVQNGLHHIVKMFQVGLFIAVTRASAFVLSWRLPTWGWQWVYCRTGLDLVTGMEEQSTCFENAWDRFNWNLANTILEAGEPRMHLRDELNKQLVGIHLFLILEPDGSALVFSLQASWGSPSASSPPQWTRCTRS